MAKVLIIDDDADFVENKLLEPAASEVSSAQRRGRRKDR